MNKQKEKKGHHFVPQTYFKKFGFEQEKDKYFVYAFDKKEESFKGKIPIDRIGKKNHFYRLEGDTQEERQFVENFYDKFTELDYTRIYKILTDKKQIKISDETREFIIFSVLTLYFRNYFWFETGKSFWNNLIHQSYEMVKDFEDKTVYSEDGQKLFSFNEITLEEMIKIENENTRQLVLKKQLKKTLNLFKIRKNDVITVNYITDNLEYITSDNPVIWQQYGQVIYLPLDFKNCLVLTTMEDNMMRDNIYRRELNGALCKIDVDFNNTNQITNANRHIIGSESEIKRLPILI